MSVLLGCIADDFTGATDLAGSSLEDAVYAMEGLEETAKRSPLLHGRNPRCLSEDQTAELQEACPS